MKVRSTVPFEGMAIFDIEHNGTYCHHKGGTPARYIQDSRIGSVYLAGYEAQKPQPAFGGTRKMVEKREQSAVLPVPLGWAPKINILGSPNAGHSSAKSLAFAGLETPSYDGPSPLPHSSRGVSPPEKNLRDRRRQGFEGFARAGFA